MAFGIVKYAADGYWEHNWDEDPKIGKVHPTHSIAGTFVGKELGIKKDYPTRADAEKDLARASATNPTVGYAICEFTEE